MCIECTDKFLQPHEVEEQRSRRMVEGRQDLPGYILRYNQVQNRPMIQILSDQSETPPFDWSYNKTCCEVCWNRFLHPIHRDRRFSDYHEYVELPQREYI